MTKYHINSKGVPAICRAKKHCPLGAAFGNKNEAFVAAEEERNIFTKEEQEKNKKTKDVFEQRLRQSEFSEIENSMIYSRPEALESVYSRIKEKRESTENIEKEIENLDNKRKELEKKKEKRKEKIKEGLTESKERILGKEKEYNELTKMIESQTEEVENYNSRSCSKCGKGTMTKKKGKFGEFLACSNYPECKNTDKPKEVNKGLIKRAEAAKQYALSGEGKLNWEARELQKKDKESLKIEEQIKKINEEKELLKYIERSGESTAIEEFYEQRKAADKMIEKKIGVNKISLDSFNSNFGSNLIKEKLTVDSKGQINNLYMEDPNKPGEIKRVVKLHESAKGNIEFEDGTRTELSTYYNFKSERTHPTIPKNFRFYVANSKSKREYDGYKSININSYDSGD